MILTRIDEKKCVAYSEHMAENFGAFIHERREEKRKTDRNFSLRQVAKRIGVEPSYLSKLERGDYAPLSEEKLVLLAKELDEDPDVVMAMCGKISNELQKIILERPKLFAELIRSAKSMPDAAVIRIVREVRDGDW